MGNLYFETVVVASLYRACASGGYIGKLDLLHSDILKQS
jgi:hypothetical protein